MVNDVPVPFTTFDAVEVVIVPVRGVAVQVVATSQLPLTTREITTAAVVYGPTNGPPSPTGAAPAGWSSSAARSWIARSRFRRPLPVPPFTIGSAFRARRPTTVPLDASGEFARISAAAPATVAAEAEVPVMFV